MKHNPLQRKSFSIRGNKLSLRRSTQRSSIHSVCECAHSHTSWMKAGRTANGFRNTEILDIKIAAEIRDRFRIIENKTCQKCDSLINYQIFFFFFFEWRTWWGKSFPGQQFSRRACEPSNTELKITQKAAQALGGAGPIHLCAVDMKEERIPTSTYTS